MNTPLSSIITLNKNGWRRVDPPVAGLAATCIPGQLIARDDRTGLGVLRKQDGTEIKIHVQWFEPNEKTVEIKTVRPTRAAAVDPMKELLEKLLASLS